MFLVLKNLNHRPAGSSAKFCSIFFQTFIQNRNSKIKILKRRKTLQFTVKMTSPAQSSIGILVKTMDFAARKHKDQRRKDKEQTPYINHPIGVANILVEEGGVEDVAVLQAALLHDTVEDTETTLQEIEEHFGSKVASIVNEVTDNKLLPKEERKAQQISTAAKKSVEAKLVKMADKIYNLRDLERSCPVGWDEKRRAEYFLWARQVVENCYSANERLETILKGIFEKNIK